MAFSTRFNLTVKRPDGSGIAGAKVRVLKENGDDISYSLWGRDESFTDTYGVFDDPITNGSIPADSTPYIIQIQANRFDTLEMSAVGFTLYVGTFVANMEPGQVFGEYSVTTPNAQYLSALYPISCQASTPGTSPWELIRFTITHSDGRVSVLEAPVDPTTHIATADIHNRVRLHPRINLVADGEVALPDPNFSDKVNVLAESVTDEGTASLGLGFSSHVANMEPSGSENNLNNYVASATGGGWITLLGEPIIFRGFYFDAMVWLPNTEEGEGETTMYTLVMQHFNGGGIQVGSTIQEAVAGNDLVQRIRFNANPDEAVKSTKAWFSDADGQMVIPKLTLRYRG